MTAQSAKLFRNGGSQAVRLPAEFRFEGVDEVRIWRDPVTGDVVLSARKRTPEEFIKFRDSLGPLDAEEIEALTHRDQRQPYRDPFAGWDESNDK